MSACSSGPDWEMCWDTLMPLGSVFCDGSGQVGDDLRQQTIPADRVGQNDTGMFMIGFPRAVSQSGYTRQVMLWKIGDFDDATTGDFFDSIPDDTKTCVECVGDEPPGTVVPGDCEVTQEDLDTTWVCDIPTFSVPFFKEPE